MFSVRSRGQSSSQEDSSSIRYQLDELDSDFSETEGDLEAETEVEEEELACFGIRGAPTKMDLLPLQICMWKTYSVHYLACRNIDAVRVIPLIS